MLLFSRLTIWTSVIMKDIEINVIESEELRTVNVGWLLGAGCMFYWKNTTKQRPKEST